ncbi:MAG: winged helix-turn-helix transcriptional regulator [Acidiferrobacteraceae bacterium]
MKRADSPCPTDHLLRLLSGAWTTHILWVLQQEQVRIRFGVLKRQVTGISARLLAERLRLLADAGLIDRDYRPTVPPEVSYGLTARGRELGKVLKRLDQLAREWSCEDTADPPALPRGAQRYSG